MKRGDDEDDMFPLSDTPNLKQDPVVYAIMGDTLSQVYICFPGRFLHSSSRGNEYILIGYHHDGDAILSTPMWRRTATEITRGWRILNKNFASASTESTSYIINNEVNLLLKPTMTKKTDGTSALPYGQRCREVNPNIQESTQDRTWVYKPGFFYTRMGLIKSEQ